MKNIQNLNFDNSEFVKNCQKIFFNSCQKLKYNNFDKNGENYLQAHTWQSAMISVNEIYNAY